MQDFPTTQPNIFSQEYILPDYEGHFFPSVTIVDEHKQPLRVYSNLKPIYSLFLKQLKAIRTESANTLQLTASLRA